MIGLRQALFFVGVTAVVILLAQLPADVFATTRAVILLVSGAILVLLAASVLLAPARQLAGRAFGFAVRDRPAFSVAASDEWPFLIRPLFLALVLLAIALLPMLIR